MSNVIDLSNKVYYNCWQSNANITAWMAAHNMTGDYEGLENYYEQRLIKIVNTLNTNYIVWEVRWVLYTHFCM